MSRATSEAIPRYSVAFIAGLTLVLLVSIFLFLLLTAAPMFRDVALQDFLFKSDWNPTSYHTASWGVGGLLASTALVTGLAMLLAIPAGLATAVYLSEIASSKIRELVKPSIEMIASIPTVTLGLVGLLYVAPVVAGVFALSNGLNALTAALLVAIATLPTIASIGDDAMTSVRQPIREASLALGATQWQTIWRVVLPAASHGIMAAVMLGLGRIIGETMIVLMVAGNSRAVPTSLFDPVRPLTATIAIEVKEVVTGSVHWHALFALGLLLFLITLGINLIADGLTHVRENT